MAALWQQWLSFFDHLNLRMSSPTLSPSATRERDTATDVLSAGVSPSSTAYRRIARALFLAGFSTFSLLYCVQPLLPAFTREFGIGAAASSLSLSFSLSLSSRP